VDKAEHNVQDACELLAAAIIQREAARLRRADAHASKTLFREYEQYVAQNQIPPRDFEAFPEYRRACEVQIPKFVDAFCTTVTHGHILVTNVERKTKKENRKRDFILSCGGRDYGISLKNYRSGFGRIQVSAGTFNSFVNNLLFKQSGVGWCEDAQGRRFRGADISARNSAIEALGLGEIVPLVCQLDRLNQEVRSTFLAPEFEFLDEERFDAARKRIGAQGAAICDQILGLIPPSRVLRRLLHASGLAADAASDDGDLLLVEPTRFLDSITNPRMRRLRSSLRSERTRLLHECRGQTIYFTFVDENRDTLLCVQVPFTINKNGAWVSEIYAGAQWHAKEGMFLSTGQRRPKKSRELATSINTYLDLRGAGLIDD
jgi:hypothetical protein